MRSALVRRAAWGVLLGVWMGLADGALSLPRAAGATDRLLGMGVSIELYLVLFTLLALALGGLWSAVRGGRKPVSGRRVPLLLSLSGVGVLVAAAIAVLGAAAGAAPGGNGDRPNLLLISVDTLRADHLGIYGYDRATSPHIDAFAATGVVFKAAYSSASWTLPAHASLLTGLDPIAHGTIDEESALPARISTLAERLRAAGYRTEAWVGTPRYGYVGAAFGLDAGFDTYRHYPHARRHRSALIARLIDATILQQLSHDVGNARDQVDSVIDWLRGSRERPFFVFVHFYDVHSKTYALPYEAPGSYRDRFCPAAADDFEGCRGRRCASDRLVAMANREEPPFDPAALEVVRCLYDGGVAFVDHEIGRLLAFLDQSGLSVDTAVVLTSDHGEAFFEHGSPLHTTLHDEITRVPLVIRLPGGLAGKRAEGLVSLIDVAPTLLELAGASRDDLQGQSLVPVLRDWPALRSSEVLAVSRFDTMLRTGSLKYIEDGINERGGSRTRPALYELSEDPAERDDRITWMGERAEELSREVARRREASRALRRELLGGEAPKPVGLSEDERARLRALGYVAEPAAEE